MSAPERVWLDSRDDMMNFPALTVLIDEPKGKRASEYICYVPASRLAALEAERDALVPLARWALFAISEAYARESNIVSRELLNEAERAGLYDPNDMDDVMDNMPKIIAARRIVEGT